MTFTLIEPDLGRVSGGLRYNAELCAASGGRIERVVAPGDWPEASPAEVQRLRELVAHSGPVLVDGLIGCALSEPLTGEAVIIHHSPAQTPASRRREAQCLRAATAVITPSAFAAAEVARRYAVTAEVARPGTIRRLVSRPGPRPHFICIGAMEDNKNQLFLAEVLHELRDRGSDGWRCSFAGPETDRDFAQQVCEALSGVDNVDCLGELDPDAIDALYRHADLLLLPSKTETFGMVVREAASAAIPSLVTAGTGAEEALAAGRALPLDAEEWADFLERWMRDDVFRGELTAAALRERESSMHGWDETARRVLSVLGGIA